MRREEIQSSQSQTLGRIGRTFQKGVNERKQRARVQKGLKNWCAGFRDVNCTQNIEYGTLLSTSDSKIQIYHESNRDKLRQQIGMKDILHVEVQMRAVHPHGHRPNK